MLFHRKEMIRMNICARQFTVIGAIEYINENGVVDDYLDKPRNMFSLCLILTGIGRFIQVDKLLVARPGYIVFSPIGSKFRIKWEGEPESRMLALHFLFPPMGNPYTQTFSQQIIRATPELEENFAFIVRNFADEKSSLRVLSKFYDVIDTVFGMLTPDELPDASPEILKARRFIDENCCRKLTIEEIATHCGLSRSYFQHQFKAATGLTPIEYKNRAAISRAERILSENRSIPIEEVSEMTGF